MALRNHKHPIRDKDQALDDFVARVRKGFDEKHVQPAIARYEAAYAGCYDNFTLDQCEAELERACAELARLDRQQDRDLVAPVWANERRYECFAGIRLIKKRKADLLSLSGLSRIFGGRAA